MTRRLVTFLPLLMLTVGCAAPQQRYQYSQLLMGVQVRLVVYAPNDANARSACTAAFERVAELEDIMSDYRPRSELMRLCARSGQGPVKVSDDLLFVLEYAQEVSSRSDGAFDVTVGPEVALWHAARKSRALPTTQAIEEAKSRTGWRLMKIDQAARTVELLHPGMKLDLGGIAKGYAGDEAIKILRQHGIQSALFEAGGDIVLSDAPPHARGWKIELPDGRNLTLHNTAISTSGDTAQFLEIAGQRYSHVVDPHTGVGLTNHCIATVIAPRGITTDALSTAATVLGPGRGRDFFGSYPAAKWWIVLSSPTPQHSPAHGRG